MSLLLLLLTASTTPTWATSPATILLKVTVRDFINGHCLNYTDPATNPQCPNDPILWDKIRKNELSGHMDFEPYQGKWGNEFFFSCVTKKDYPGQVPYLLDISAIPCSQQQSYPLVARTMDWETSGLYKPRRCLDYEPGMRCDGNITVGSKRSVYSSESFRTWFRDDLKFNRRFGYAQKLYRVGPAGSNVYTFSSSTNDPFVGTESGSFAMNNPVLGIGFFDPIHENLKSGEAFPKNSALCSGIDGYISTPTPCERDYDLNLVPPKPSRFYSFTTQISTWFEYRGNEQFTFVGDDDVFVYVNENLVLDMGGVHPFVSGSLNFTFGSPLQNYLQLQIGEIYSITFFNTERQTFASNFKLTTSLAQTCNVVTTELRTNSTDVEIGIDWPHSTNASSFFLLGGPTFGKFDAFGTKINLMTPNNHYAVGYAFHRALHNVASGFRLLFSFAFGNNAFAGDAFSVILHSRSLGLKNLNGGTGPNAGIKNMENCFAVVFDLCADRSIRNCTDTQLSVHYRKDGNKMNDAGLGTRTVWENVVTNNWKDGRVHRVEILYYSRPDWLEVYVDDDLRLVERNFDAVAILGGRKAYVGFSASTSERDLSVAITEVKITTVKVPSRYSYFIQEPASSSPITFVANGRSAVEFRMATRDACQNDVDFGGLGSRMKGCIFSYDACRGSQYYTDDPSNTNACLNPSTLSTIVERPGWLNNHTYYLCTTGVVNKGTAIGGRQLSNAVGSPPSESDHAYVLDDDSGVYTAKFKTFVTGTFSVCVADGAGCVWDPQLLIFNATTPNDCSFTCHNDAATAVPYQPPTLAPTLAAEPIGVGKSVTIGVSVFLGLLGLCCFIVFGCFFSWRSTWRRDKRFIEAGRLAAAEKGVEYIGDSELDHLKHKLQVCLMNLQKERLKRNQLLARDEIDRLLMQKGELQEQIRMLQMRQGDNTDGASDRSEDFPFAQYARRAWKRMTNVGNSLVLSTKPGESESVDTTIFGTSHGDRLRESAKAKINEDTFGGNPIFLALKMEGSNRSYSARSMPPHVNGDDATDIFSAKGTPALTAKDEFIPSAGAMRRQSRYAPSAARRASRAKTYDEAKLVGQESESRSTIPEKSVETREFVME